MSQDTGEEAHRKWGHTEAYQIAVKRTNSYTPTDWKRIKLESRAIYQGFQQTIDAPLDSEQVLRWVDEWQQHIDQYYYPCNDEMLLSLAGLYEQDPRYQKNIDKVGGTGTASRIVEAIRFHKASAQ